MHAPRPVFSRRPLRGVRACHVFVSLLVAGAALRAADEVPTTPKAIHQELRSFATVATVLYVAAHPDDESNALLAQLARGRGYRTAYLSLTRGDGGQNELGPEFGERLGLARTHELLAARRIDGGRQYFTLALDYGYSKDVNEALRLWEKEKVLGDVVRVYRMFRPDVVIAGFSPVQTPGQHGQHVASAVLAIEAFKISGDPTKYPEQLAEGLTPWQPKRIVGRSGGGRGGRGGGDAGKAATPAAGTVRFDSPEIDPASGENLSAIATRSRAQHKTQFGPNFGAAGGGGFGTAPGPATFTIIAGDPATQGDLLDGLDLTLARFPGCTEIARLAEEVVAKFSLDDPTASVPALLEIRTKIAELPRMDRVLGEKYGQLERILQACLGLSVESVVEDAEVVPGESVRFRHSVTMKANASVQLEGIVLRGAGFSRELFSLQKKLKSGEPLVFEETRVVFKGAQITHPYWLREEPAAGRFKLDPDDYRILGLPEGRDSLMVDFNFGLPGHDRPLTIVTVPVQIVSGAPAAQQRRKLAVIPPVSLGFPYETEVFTLGATKTTIVEVTAARAGSSGAVKLSGPAGWKISPASQSFKLAQAGDKVRVSFTVTAPAQTSRGSLSASADVGGATYGTGRVVFNYPHIPVQLLQPPARLKVAAIDVAVRGKAVGYLPGAGDNTAENLEQLGYAVRTLTDADLTPEKLAGLDAVVIGVRAFNERRALAAALPGLFAWVEAGGTVIAQYNRPNNNLRGPLAPYDLSINGSAPALRVTDETAPVTFTTPGHPALNVPNKIGPADFEGWVQERGAYFPATWDQTKFTTLLAMSDPGEKQPDSSILVARHGKGYYVYTGVAFFRQLPAGVPGAYRLFANLVSLGK